MKYEIKNFSNLVDVGKISNEAMLMHFKLYEGYVSNTNSLLEKLNTLAPNTPEWNELNRRLGWEWNGMRNHELFFESLTTAISQDGSALEKFSKQVSSSFGSFDNWKNNFVNICKIRGIGWAVLVQDRRTKQLMNVWVNEHDAGMLSDVDIILNVDMFEHAYVKDFGTDRGQYLESVLAHINWEIVWTRLQR